MAASLGKLAAAGAALACALAAAPAGATQLYWSYVGYNSVPGCLQRASEAARDLGMQAITRTEYEVRGEVNDQAYATIVCIPNSNGSAFAVVMVAADGHPDDTGVSAAQIRDWLADHLER